MKFQFQNNQRFLRGSVRCAAVSALVLAAASAMGSPITFLNSWGTAGNAPGQFSFPRGIALGNDGSVYVADTGNNRIQQFDATGHLENTFGSTGAGPGQFTLPRSLAVAPDGTIYVTDTGNNRVEIFNSAGDYQSAFGGFGSGNGKFNYPDDITLGAGGTVSVYDTLNHRIEVFSAAGVYQSNYATGPLTAPTQVTAQTGMIYLLDNSNSRVARYFDPAQWTAGANAFTDATVGPTSVTAGAGQILGSSLTLGANMGLVVGQNTTINSDGSLNLQGSLNTAALIVAGQFSSSGGSLTTQNISVTGAGNLQLAQPGNLTLANFSLAGSAQASLDGGISVQAQSTTIGDGTTLNLANASVDSSQAMQIGAGANVHLINASQSILTAPSTLNLGTIAGAGQINAPLTNNSQLTAAAGELLTIAGSGNINNANLSVTGGSINFTGDLTNAATGQIIITGGTLGAAGGLTNHGAMQLAGPAAINAALANAIDGEIEFTAGGTTIHGLLSNAGSLQIDTGASATFAGGYTGAGSLNNAGAISFNADSTVPTITGGGDLAIGSLNAPAALRFTAASQTVDLASLTLPIGSTLDIGSDTFFISLSNQPGHDALSIIGLIHEAQNNNAWNMPGITSSSLTTLTTLGYRLIGDQIEIKPALIGDLNLDGIVDLLDLGLMNQSMAGGTGLPIGDLNGDGVENVDDWALFYTSASRFPAFAPTVPEPAILPLLTAAALLLPRRRNRKV